MFMNSPNRKLDSELERILERVNDDALLKVDIYPLQNRWMGLLDQLRRSGRYGVEYNVIDLTSISAILPKSLIRTLVERRDVVAVHLRGDDR